jgi:hypothetical protein
MCTITFIPNDCDYLLAMNRDDLLTRASTLPLVRASFASQAAAYPQETGGGTWIGVNQHGITVALLNWAVPPRGPKEKSRGTVIPQMLASVGVEHARIVYDEIDLDGIYPFRLIGIFPVDRSIIEWRWDGEARREQSLEWGARQWFSSGAGDDEAARIRSAVSRTHWHDEGVGSREWLRRLHASHEPEQGVFSICAHRDVGGTLSYTEIEVAAQHVALSYSPVAPCKGIDFSDEVTMPRLVRTAAFV